MQKESDYKSSTIMMTKDGYQNLVDTKDGKNLYWSTDVNFELPIKIPATGRGSLVKPQTLPQFFRRIADKRGQFPGLKVQRKNKEYVWTWRDYFNDSFAFAKALHFLGVTERKAVNIMGFNSPEWAIAFFGSVFHNNVASGVYITNGPKACLYQAQNSEA